MSATRRINELRAARLAGEAVKSIAERFGATPSAVYQAFRRELGGTPLPGPANENRADRKTEMTARNGGCSTTSGLMPVTLSRIPTMDREPVKMSARERLLAANDNRRGTEIGLAPVAQVAA